MKTLFKGDLFTIKQKVDSFGKVRELCFRPPSVADIAITNDKKIVVVNEKRPLFKERIYALPSGRVDKETDIKEAAQRELREESGYRAESLELFMKSKPSNSFKYDVYFFIGRNLEKDPLPHDIEEDIIVEYKTLDEVAKLALEGNFRPDNGALAVLRFKNAVDTGRNRL